MTKTGLDRLIRSKDLQHKLEGNIGYLCHPASIDSNLDHGIELMREVFGSRLTTLFSPQHGLFADEQDNMVESPHFFHGHYQLQVYSLYSEHRKPTSEMLANLDHVIIDLQDVGTRIYTYIYTMTLMMEACAVRKVKVTILDRPNPIDGITIEGNVLDANFKSFIGRHELPMRHGLTIGEVANMAVKYWDINCNLDVITMEGWGRKMNFNDTDLPWVLPSPNLPTVDGAYAFPGSVLFEGTNISEGRGTSRGLEIVGHPQLKHLQLLPEIEAYCKLHRLLGFKLRPLSFIPTFQKHKGIPCHGYQIHVTDKKTFQPWRLGQVLCQFFYHHLGDHFQWKQPPYEYEYDLLPIDILNGTDQIRDWVVENGSMDQLVEIESAGLSNFIKKRESILLY